MSRPRREPVSCGHCGQLRKCSRLILEQPVCQTCMQRYARAAKPCPGCGQVRVLAFYDSQRRPACARCTGNDPVYACTACGREDSQWGRRCAPCVLAERAAALLASPEGGIHPRLRPVYDVLLAGPRPQTTLYWFTRSTGPAILSAMARGELAISHATFEAMPVNKTNNYLRDLLVAVGVLPPFHAELERVTPWLRELQEGLPPGQAEVLSRFARWRVLRRLRQQEQRGTVTHGAIAAARATLVTTVRFLNWCTSEGLDVADLTQADLDRYTEHHRGRAIALGPFIDWAGRTGLTRPGLRPPIARRPPPKVVLSDAQRWRQVELLLHDDSMRLYTRIAGLFVLLYAQSLSRVCRMRAEQIHLDTPGAVTVTFDTIPIELPTPLDDLVRQHLTRRGQASYASRADTWLFPGGIPGKHLATENMRAQLVARDIRPHQARNAAMFQLAADMPTPVLAELLGLAHHTASRWAALAARDWNRYIALRKAHHADDGHAPIAKHSDS